MTQFGYPSSTTSPARRRIEAAGRAFNVVDENDAADPVDEINVASPRVAAEIAISKARLRRQRIYDRVERGWMITANSLFAAEITMREIAAETCRKHGNMTLAMLKSQCRRQFIVRARQEAYWRCHHETTRSLTEIGRFFGGFDHTTVLHGIRQHEKRMEGNGV